MCALFKKYICMRVISTHSSRVTSGFIASQILQLIVPSQSWDPANRCKPRFTRHMVLSPPCAIWAWRSNTSSNAPFLISKTYDLQQNLWCWGSNGEPICCFMYPNFCLHSSAMGSVSYTCRNRRKTYLPLVYATPGQWYKSRTNRLKE